MSDWRIILEWPFADLQNKQYIPLAAGLAAAYWWGGGLPLQGQSAMVHAQAYLLGGAVNWAYYKFVAKVPPHLVPRMHGPRYGPGPVLGPGPSRIPGMGHPYGPGPIISPMPSHMKYGPGPYMSAPPPPEVPRMGNPYGPGPIIHK